MKRTVMFWLAVILRQLTEIGRHDLPLYVELGKWIEDERECRLTGKACPDWMYKGLS